jgi:uncharacterized protein
MSHIDPLDELATALSEITHEDDGMVLSEFDGFCTALIIGPELVAPSEWLPAVLGGDGAPPASASSNDLCGGMELIMGHYSVVSACLNPPEETFSPVFDINEHTGDLYWGGWVAGFERAMRLRPEAWADLIDQTEGTEFQDVGKAVAMMLELVAIRDGRSKLTDEQLSLVMVDAPETIADIVLTIQAWTLFFRHPSPEAPMRAANH